MELGRDLGPLYITKQSMDFLGAIRKSHGGIMFGTLADLIFAKGGGGGGLFYVLKSKDYWVNTSMVLN